MREKYIHKPVPTSDNLAGTYEMLLGSCLAKVSASIVSSDKSYIFHAARSAQVVLNEIAENSGTYAYDVMQYYDADNPEKFKAELVKAINQHLIVCESVGCKILQFETFDALYDYCMNP